MKDVRLFILSMIAMLAFAGAGCAAQETKKTVAAPAKTEAVKSDAAAAEKPAAREPEERLAPEVREATLKTAYDAEYKKCVEKSLPIDKDEFYLALAGKPDGSAVFEIKNEFSSYVTCRLFSNSDVLYNDASTYLVEPAFKSGVGTSGLSISKDSRDKSIATLSEIIKKSMEDNIILLLAKGDRTFMGKPIAEGACGMVGEKSRAGCLKSWSVTLQALEQKDESLCETISPYSFPGAKEWCYLIVSKNPELCKIDGFLKPAPYEACMDFATIFQVISGEIKDINKAVLLKGSVNANAVISAKKTNDKCATYAKESLLPKYCEWRAGVAKLAATDQMKKEDEAYKKTEMEKINAKLEAELKQKEADRLVEEEHAREIEARKKAEEEAAKGSSGTSAPDTEKKEAKPETAPSKDTKKPAETKDKKPAAPTTKKTAGGK